MERPNAILRIGLSLGCLVLTACIPTRPERVASTPRPITTLILPPREVLPELTPDYSVCLVEDLDQELAELVEGWEPYPFLIGNNPRDLGIVEPYFNTSRFLLPAQARELQQRQMPDSHKAFELATTYAELRNLAGRVAQRYGGRAGELLSVLARCNDYKIDSLVHL